MLLMIAWRIAAAVPVVFVVATVVFALLRLSPGDPAIVMAGDSASPELIEQVRSNLGLDQPIYTQYSLWLEEMLKGNLGTSIQSKQSVAALVVDRLEPTLMLAASSILLTVLIAVPLGAIAAWNHNRWIDRVVMALSVAGFSMPTFVVGYLLILGFAMWADLLPVQGYVSPFRDFVGSIKHLILPSLTLSFVLMALIARVTRSSVLDILGENFIKTALAKGSSGTRILWRHALPNAAVPVITVIGAAIAFVISGVVVTESVFNIPGLGRLTVDAILSRDYPVVQGLLLLFALVYAGINLLIDVLYVIVDPRIRY